MNLKKNIPVKIWLPWKGQVTRTALRSPCSVIVRVSVVLKRTVRDSD